MLPPFSPGGWTLYPYRDRYHQNSSRHRFGVLVLEDFSEMVLCTFFPTKRLILSHIWEIIHDLAYKCQLFLSALSITQKQCSKSEPSIQLRTQEDLKHFEAVCNSLLLLHGGRNLWVPTAVRDPTNFYVDSDNLSIGTVITTKKDPCILTSSHLSFHNCRALSRKNAVI